MSTQEWDDRIKAINDAIESGNIERSSRAKLVQFNAWLCHSNAHMHLPQNYVQVCETVRLHLLRTMFDSFEERTKKSEFWVKALAVAALTTSVIQIFSPVLFREPPIALVPPASTMQLSIPAPATPQVCDPTTKKKP